MKRLTKQAMGERTEENEQMELTKSGDNDESAEDSDSVDGDLLEVKFGTGRKGMKIMQVKQIFTSSTWRLKGWLRDAESSLEWCS